MELIQGTTGNEHWTRWWTG